VLRPPSTRAARWAALIVPLFLTGIAAPAAMADAPPTAAFDMTVNGRPVTVVKPGTTVTFTDRSTDSDGRIVQRGWDVNGDGVISDRDGPASLSRHFGGPPRLYTIILRVTDNAGNTDEARRTLAVVPPGQQRPPPAPAPDPPPAPANRAPVSAFTFSPASPRVGEAVTFTSTATDPDGGIAAFAWDVDGDGRWDDGNGASTTRTFASPGNRTVALRVLDNRLAVNVAFRTLRVQPAAPSAAAAPAAPATASPAIAVLPLGATQPQLRQPELTVRIRGKILPTTVRVLGLSVKAPTGFKARAWCIGRGCPFTKAVRRVRNGFARFTQLQRTLRAGTIIRVTVTKPFNWGRYTSLRLRRGAAPDRKDRCLRGESVRPVPCPPPA
jgi:PKD repeat protein